MNITRLNYKQHTPTYHRNDKTITAAADPGNSIYVINKQDVEDIIRGTNLIVEEAFKLYGWNAFDIESMYGSAVIDDTLYFLKSDGSYVDIEGEDVDPEEMLSKYSIEDIPSYLIKQPDPSILKHNFTYYELSDSIDINEIALSLLESGFKFTSIVDDAKDAGFVE